MTKADTRGTKADTRLVSYTGVWLINFAIAAEATLEKYGKITKLPREAQI